mgnify:CR=1 FL=1
MSNKENENENAEQLAENSATENAAELNLNDLNAMKIIIDIASSRGAFKPNEMAVVGQTYNKLTSFLDQVAKQAEQQGKQNG